ncbi:MAG: transglutaminase-like domain-containing protein [Bacteroidota bacterium]
MTENKRDKELKALISLLDEPDNGVYEQIRSKIYAYGIDAIPVLEDSWEQSFDHQLQERIEEIIHMIQLDDLYAGISSWAQLASDDLMKGFMLAARYQYPDFDSEKVIKQIGQLVQDVWLELNDKLTALEKIKVVNHIFFDVHKFRGNKSNLKSPDNLHLNILLETKKGNPLSIGILYIIIARSLKLPVYGVDLPNHFILAYMDEIGSEAGQTDANALFYINPFNRGALFTHNEIEAYIRQMKLKHNDSYFQSCNNITIMRRVFGELIELHQQQGNLEKVEELKKLASGLS